MKLCSKERENIHEFDAGSGGDDVLKTAGEMMMVRLWTRIVLLQSSTADRTEGALLRVTWTADVQVYYDDYCYFGK